MDASQLEALLRGIGAERVRMVDSRKVSCACPLARWTHSKGHDNHPSFIAFVQGKHGDPIYACQACHEEGSIRDLLLFLWSKGRDTFHWIEVLDDQAPVERALKKSEQLLKASKEASVQGFQVTRVDAPPVVQNTFSDGRPFYDYKCLAEADAVPEVPWAEYEPYLGEMSSYAIERGLTPETYKAWELGDDKRSQRLLFPIRDRKGRLVAISGRLYATACVRCGGAWVPLCSECGNDKTWHETSSACAKYEAGRDTCIRCGTPRPPKYMHRKGFQRNLLLYGEHRHDQDKTDGRVYVVEGHLDMIRMWQAGYRPVVALLGTGAGEPQVEKLIAQWGDGRVICVPDGDDAGRKMAARLKELIADRVPFTSKKLPDGVDPGSMSVDDLKVLLGEPSWPRLSRIDKVNSGDDNRQ